MLSRIHYVGLRIICASLRIKWKTGCEQEWNEFDGMHKLLLQSHADILKCHFPVALLLVPSLTCNLRATWTCMMYLHLTWSYFMFVTKNLIIQCIIIGTECSTGKFKIRKINNVFFSWLFWSLWIWLRYLVKVTSDWCISLDYIWTNALPCCKQTLWSKPTSQLSIKEHHIFPRRFPIYYVICISGAVFNTKWVWSN